MVQFRFLLMLILSLISSTIRAENQIPAWIAPQVGLSVYQDLPKPSFSLHGLLQIDQMVLLGSREAKKTDFLSGANLRRALIEATGHFNATFAYQMGFEYGQAFPLRLKNLAIHYDGLHPLNKTAIGQFKIPFGLEAGTARDDLVFMETSTQAEAFDPHYGLGLTMRQSFAEWGLIQLAGFTPPINSANTSPINANYQADDKLSYSARVVMSPVFDQMNVYHLGLSYLQRNLAPHALAGSAYTPQQFYALFLTSHSRNAQALLGIDTQGVKAIGQLNMEAALASGPFLFQAEWTQARLKGPTPAQPRAYYLQASYLFDHIAHPYDALNGYFLRPKPGLNQGLWELGFRLSRVNLNRGAFGGRGQTAGFALNYYLNSQLKLSTNYQRIALYAKHSTTRRRVDNLSMRLQLVW